MTVLDLAPAVTQQWDARKLPDLRAWYDAEWGQPKYVGYVQLNGSAGDNISTPDSVNLDMTGDIEVVMRVRVTDWTAASNQTLCGKYITTSNQRSWRFYANTSGSIGLTASHNGTTVTSVIVTPTVALTDDAWIWLRLRLDLSNGSNSVGTVETAADAGTNIEPSSWTANGTNTGVIISGVFDSSAPLEIGAFANGASERLYGDVGRCIVRDGIGGAVVADFNADDCFGDGYVHTDGYWWTLGLPKIYDRGPNGFAPATFGAGSNQPKWLPWDGTPSVYLPGVTGNYVSCPNAAPLRITGDIEIVARVALVDWTPSADQIVLSRRQSSNWSYQFAVEGTTGKLMFSTTNDGVSGGLVNAKSSVGPTVSDGATLWVKATVSQSGNVVRFYTAADQAGEPASWTQLGSDVSITGITMWAGTAPLEIGSRHAGSLNNLSGRLYRAIVRSGIAGTVVADFDASLCTQSGCTDSLGNVWTVNRSTSGRKAVVQSPVANSARSVILFGTDDYIDVPAAAVPTFGIADAGSVLIAERQHATQVNYRRIFSTEAANNQGLQIAARDGGSVSIGGFFGDSVGPTLVGNDIANIPMGTRTVVSMSVSGRSATGITLRANAANPVAVSNAAVGNVPINSPSRLGAPAFTTTPFAEFEFEALALRGATTSSTEHAQLVASYNGGL